MYWFPKSRLGKISFWLAIAGIALLFIPYWLSMLFHIRMMFSGFLTMLFMAAAGVTSILAIIVHKDRAILLALPILVGIMALLFMVGEFIFPH